MITVIDVCRAMRVEITPQVSWSVGAQARGLYAQRTGRLPEKDLRQKTSGGGSHCFAVYPDWMRPEIEQIIRAHKVEDQRQGVLL